MDKLTAETITEQQIKALRAEAQGIGDDRQVIWCDVALAAHETSDSSGNRLMSPDGDRVTRSRARSACAYAINHGLCSEDE